MLLHLVGETIRVLDGSARAFLLTGGVDRDAVVWVVDADRVGALGPHASVGTLLVACIELGPAALVYGNLIGPGRSKGNEKSCGNERELHRGGWIQDKRVTGSL